MKETDEVIEIVVDPLAKNQATVIKVEEVEARKKSKLSPMPLGMVDKLSREEILDLIAYIISKGDMKHKVFEGGHDHSAHGSMKGSSHK